MVDVVAPESGADQLLEEVGLLVGALRRTEAGDPVRAALGVDLAQASADEVEGLFPACLAEVRHHLVVRHEATRLATALAVGSGLAHVLLHICRERTLGVGGVDPDQRLGQSLRGRRVVPAVAALDAQPALRTGLVAALGEGDPPALAVDIEGQCATDAAVRADGVDCVELLSRLDRDVVDRLVGECAGRARRHTLTAGDARRLAHRVVEVEGDAGRVALATAADDVVALDVVAGSDAAVAEDAGVMVDGDHRIRGVGPPRRSGKEVVDVGDHQAVSHGEQLVVGGGGLLGVLVPWPLVVEEQLGEHLATVHDLGRRGGHLHVRLTGSDARRRIGTSTHVHHAHPADADRVVALVVAQHRDLDPELARGLPDRRPFGDRDALAVDGERDRANLGLRWSRTGDGHALDSLPGTVWTSGRPSGSSPRSV